MGIGAGLYMYDVVIKIYNSIATLLTSHKQLQMLTILSILYGI